MCPSRIQVEALSVPPRKNGPRGRVWNSLWGKNPSGLRRSAAPCRLTLPHTNPVTRVSNGMAGGADLILTKAWRPPSERRHWSVHCLGDTNTYGICFASHHFGGKEVNIFQTSSTSSVARQPCKSLVDAIDLNQACWISDNTICSGITTFPYVLVPKNKNTIRDGGRLDICNKILQLQFLRQKVTPKNA